MKIIYRFCVMSIYTQINKWHLQSVDIQGCKMLINLESITYDFLDNLIEKYNLRKTIKRIFGFQGKGQARYIAMLIALARNSKKSFQVRAREIATAVNLTERQIHNINKQFTEVKIFHKWKGSVKGKKGRVNCYEVSEEFEKMFVENLTCEEKKLVNEFLDELLASQKLKANQENKEKTLNKVKEIFNLTEKQIAKKYKEDKKDFKLKLLMNKELTSFILSLKGQDDYLSEIEKRRKELLSKFSSKT